MQSSLRLLQRSSCTSHKALRRWNPNGFRALSSVDTNQDSKSRNSKLKSFGAGIGVTALGLSSFFAYKYFQDEKKVFPPPPQMELPSRVDYLLIGAGTASFSAFRSIKAHDVRAKVLLVGAEDQIPYMRPPLSKEMFYNSDPDLKNSMKFEQWNGRQRSLYFEPESFYTPLEKLEDSSKGGISVLKNTWVSALDSEKQLAYLVSRDGKVGSIEYGKCLLATGARPKILSELKEIPSSSLSTFKSFNDFNKIDSLIQKGEISSVAVIGGGFLGTELSCALGARSKIIDKNFTVTQIIPEEGNMGLVLPKYLSMWMTEKVKGEGATVLTKNKVKSSKMDGKKVVLNLSNGSELKVDHVIVSVGSEPNTQLATSAELELDQGGYKVNSEFKAKKNIWAAGDVASFDDPLLGRRRIEHHDHAVISGRIAGENMSGNSMKYSKQSMFWSDLGPDIGLEAVGITDSKLPTHSVFIKNNDESPKEDISRGVVFYLQNDIIVGVLLWNIFDQIGLARRVIKEKRKFEDITEVSKLFRLVEEKTPANEANEIVPKEDPSEGCVVDVKNDGNSKMDSLEEESLSPELQNASSESRSKIAPCNEETSEKEPALVESSDAVSSQPVKTSLNTTSPLATNLEGSSSLEVQSPSSSNDKDNEDIAESSVEKVKLAE